jgi:phage N-6-adenine-methyltransferase
MNRVHFSSLREDWATPSELFAQLNAEFGFTLDAAASEHNAKAEQFYTEADDGLAQPWTGVVWCNPPYGREIHHWIEKAIRAAHQGATVVLLVPARTDSVWFQQLMRHADEIRLLAGRVTFEGATEPAPFPSAIAVLRALDWTNPLAWTRYRIPRRHDRGDRRWCTVRPTDGGGAQ